MKHGGKICDELGLGPGSKGLTSPAVRGTADEVVKEDPVLDEPEHTPFRGLAATANYLSQDRMDIQFSAKEICRGMANP